MKRQYNMRKKGRNSYYYKFFMSFIIILFVPMLTNAVIFISTQRIIKDQIQNASHNTLNQFFERVDTVMDEVRNVCVTVGNSSDSKLYSKKLVDRFDSRAYYVMKLQQQLKSYVGEKYFDVFEYYPEIDYIISANFASMNRESYYDIYYGDSQNDFWEEFKAVTETTRKNLVLISMNKNDSDPYVCAAMRKSSYKNKKYDYVLVFVLRSEYMAKLLENVLEREQNGISMIVNADQEIIFSTDDIVYEESFDGKDYVIQKQESKIIDVSYVYAVSSAYFWSKLYILYIICGFSMLVSVGIGIYIAERQTNRIYQPMGRMVSDLEKNTAITYDAEANTEIEFIKWVFDYEKKEKLMMKKNIRRGQLIQKNNFILSLLHGKNEISEITDDTFAENGMKLISNNFCVALLRVKQEQMSNSLEAFVVINVFEEICNRWFIANIVQVSDAEHAILVNINAGEDKEQLYLSLKEGRDFLSRSYDMDITIGMSSVQEGMYGIRTAYNEAKESLDYSYLLGTNIIIDYSEIAGREFYYLQASELKMLHMITVYLAGDMEETDVLSIVEELMEDYGINENASLETVECFKFECVSMFYRILMQDGFWTEEWREKIMKLLDQTTLEMFKVYFADILTQLYLKKQRNAGELDLCGKVKEYIDQHYTEEQLSRTRLSEMFGVAPGYLSRLYKEKYQFTIPEYITRMRVENAKRQLRNTDCTVQKIAEENGFVNSASFIRTFKRQEGITPNIYRELSKK